jgi:hypothetical protein
MFSNKLKPKYQVSSVSKLLKNKHNMVRKEFYMLRADTKQNAMKSPHFVYPIIKRSLDHILKHHLNGYSI